MKKTILYLWQLPQNLLGLAVIAAVGVDHLDEFRDAFVIGSIKMKGAVSLGRYIVAQDGIDDARTRLHEWGHCRQSRILGPLYLFAIGLPSLLHAWWWKPGRGKSYYDFYAEKWADRLGGVEREIKP